MQTPTNLQTKQQLALDAIRLRKQSYIGTFNPENRSVRLVMADLARFCRADRSTYDPDPRVHALLEGRREVWLRIAEHLSLTDAELYAAFVHGVR